MNAPKPHIATGSNADLLGLYRQMRRVRTFEERVGELFVRGLSAGSMLHLSIGEESAAVGVCAAMKDGDTFTTHHRGHGIFLARGADPERMMAEIAGKQTGYCHGKGGSMHIADMGLGHLGANAIVGGGLPLAGGLALADRMQATDSVTACFFGEGAVAEGELSLSEAVQEKTRVRLTTTEAGENAESQRRHQGVALRIRLTAVPTSSQYAATSASLGRPGPNTWRSASTASTCPRGPTACASGRLNRPAPE